MTREFNQWSKDRHKNPHYNWVPKKKSNMDYQMEIEDDDQQKEALLVDMGVTELMFDD